MVLDTAEIRNTRAPIPLDVQAVIIAANTIITNQAAVIITELGATIALGMDIKVVCVLKIEIGTDKLARKTELRRIMGYNRRKRNT